MASSVQPDRRAILRCLVNRLTTFGTLTASDQEAVQDLLYETEVHLRGTDLTDYSGHPQIILAGWACRMRLDTRGRRQIVGFILAGDAIGSFWRKAEFAPCRSVALTRLHTISAQSLFASDADGAFTYAAVVAAARQAEDYDQHLLFDHIARLGARDAYGGLAHLLLELHGRLDRIGLVQDGEFVLPIGQRVLAQAMGFSVAHTNHTMQRMVSDGLFETKGDVMRLLRPDKMALVADFQAAKAPTPTLGRPSEIDEGVV